jgi:Pyruvate/2-oxoacid:ferredoxin oxidoreductase delta subunit
VRRDEHGALLGLTVQRMRPGKVDEAGRHRPEPIPGDTYELDASSVVVAISQDTDWAGLEGIKAEAQSPGRETVLNRLAFGGDVLHLGIASQAIAQGRQAAEQACSGWHDDPDTTRLPDVKVDHYLRADRVAEHEVLARTRLRNPNLESSETITEDELLTEVSRCLSCGSCLGCSQCWMYCNAGAFTPRSDPEPGLYYDFNADICEGCGKCVELCPCGFLGYEPVSE